MHFLGFKNQFRVVATCCFMKFLFLTEKIMKASKLAVAVLAVLGMASNVALACKTDLNCPGGNACKHGQNQSLNTNNKSKFDLAKEDISLNNNSRDIREASAEPRDPSRFATSSYHKDFPSGKFSK